MLSRFTFSFSAPPAVAVVDPVICEVDSDGRLRATFTFERKFLRIPSFSATSDESFEFPGKFLRLWGQVSLGCFEDLKDTSSLWSALIILEALF